jgi:TPR repeat protein
MGSFYMRPQRVQPKGCDIRTTAVSSTNPPRPGARSKPGALRAAAVAAWLLATVACATLPEGVTPTARGDAIAQLTLPSGRIVRVDPDDLAYTGHARLTWPDGSEYDGEWLQGRPHGFGIATEADGARYAGDWHHGDRHGEGELTLSDGSRYEGAFAQGKRSGTGTLESAQGFYDGQWHLDMPHGEGVFVAVDGGRYQGEWRNGRQHGYGRAEGPPGLVYEGTWAQGRKHGFGRETRPDGSRYEGDWHEGKRHGQGRESGADGTVHEGAFELNQPLGPGSRVDSEGIRITGMWNQDAVSSGLLQLPSGLAYAGPLFSRSNTVAAPRLLEWLTQTAHAGDAHAQWLLGKLYLDLDQPAPDLDEARHWLTAAGARVAEAQYRLALTYQTVDPTKAAALLTEAAAREHVGANERLGYYYQAGIGVPADLERSIAHYQRAVAGGSSSARNNLAWLLATTTDARYRDASRALTLIRPIALYHGDWQYLDTLATALAAAGEFPQAVGAAQRALAAARHDPDAGADDLAALQGRLERFRNRQPYVDGP